MNAMKLLPVDSVMSRGDVLSWSPRSILHGNRISRTSVVLFKPSLNIRGGLTDIASDEEKEDSTDIADKTNEYLDDYVNRLIASVDVSSSTDSKDADTDTDTLIKESVDTNSAYHSYNQTVPFDAAVVEDVVSPTENGMENLNDDEEESNVTQHESDHEDAFNNTSSSSPTVSTASHHVSEMDHSTPLTHNTTIQNSSSSSSSSIKPRPLHPPRPPNLVYRLLLPAGLIGRVIVMLCIMIAEFLHRYIPELYFILEWICIQVGIYDPFAKPILYRPRAFYDSKQPITFGTAQVHTQYSAFISADGTSSTGGKKANSQQKKAADAVAMAKLSILGTTREAKYKHLSDAFMKQYNLGNYAQEQKVYEEWIVPTIMEEDNRQDPKNLESRTTPKEDNEDDEEEEDWVVKALSSEATPSSTLVYTEIKDIHETNAPHSSKLKKKKRRKKKGLPFQITNIEPTASIGTSGSTIGLSFNIGFHNPHEKKNKKSKMLEAAAASRTDRGTKKKVRTSPPKASDRDGGGGVLGRLRAVGANNALSSRLLGAYPGDAPSREEAANARGVIELAKKYGYGQWSDSSDSEEGSKDSIPSNTVRSPRTRRRSRTSQPWIENPPGHKEKVERQRIRTDEIQFRRQSQYPQKHRDNHRKDQAPFIPLSRIKEMDESKASSHLRRLSEIKMTSSSVRAPMKRTSQLLLGKEKQLKEEEL